MISAVVVFALIAGTNALPALHSFSLGDDGTYQFFYETGKEGGSHSREETRGSDGVVVGKYSYQDPLGDLRVVNYRADDFGYVAKGDVSVPGAPPGQFPAEENGGGEEETKGSEESSNTESSKNKVEVDEMNDSTTTEKPQEIDDDYEEDVKAIKLQEPSYDGPPDGFPAGFFDQSFQGLRRLPEPTEEDDEKSSTSSKDESETSTTTSDTKEEDKEKKQENEEKPVHLSPLFPFTNVDPHAVFNLYHPSSDPHKNPVYVYSYQHPDSHGYYYTF